MGRNNFPSEKDDWKKLEENNVTIAINVIYVKAKKEICPAWHYLAVKKLSGLLRGITLKNNGHFCCLNCLHSFRTKKLESHK